MADFFGRLVKSIFLGRPVPEGAVVVQPIKISSGIPSRIPTTDSVQLASIGLGMAPTTDGVSVATTAVGRRGVLVRGFAGQTANLAEFQDSASAELLSVDPAGNINAPATVGFKLAGAPILTLGTPATNAAPTDVEISATGGSGPNVAGANITYSAGIGTGLGGGGHHIFRTAAAGGSGSDPNTLATILELTDDAKVGFFAATPVVKQTSGADLTNNVTSGGTNDQIDDWSDLSTYATDAAAIRNAIYQLSRKLKQVNDGMRAYGMLT